MGKWERLCQDCWQDEYPTLYLPQEGRHEDCARCGQHGLTYAHLSPSTTTGPSFDAPEGTISRPTGLGQEYNL